MRALCPRCHAMVEVWPLLGLPDARRLLDANKPIVVVHVCPVVGGDHCWTVKKGESLEQEAGPDWSGLKLTSSHVLR
jgi:hypothetical protein